MNIMHVPILPIQDVVFFPHIVIPLTIENRLAMQIVKDCLKYGSPLALPFVEDYGFGGPGATKRVCSIGVPIILEEAPSYLKVLISGIGKIELGNVVQDIPYPIYEGKVIYDNNTEDTAPFEIQITRLAEILNNWIEQNVENEEEKKSFCQNINSTNQVLDYICLFLVSDLDVKQHLLENNDLHSRIKTLNLLFKNHDPFTPDFQTVNVIRDYQSIELTSKVYH